MKKITITIYVLLCTVALQAQTIKSSVISAAGNTSTAGTVTVRSTSGECMAGTLSTSTSRIRQGFQQGAITVARLEDETATETEFKFNVFPNPFTDFVNIENTGSTELQITIVLTDINGKVLEQKQMTEPAKQISFEQYTAGTYIVNVISEGKKESFRVVKK